MNTQNGIPVNGGPMHSREVDRQSSTGLIFSCSNCAQNVIIYLFLVMITSHDCHQHLLCILAKQKKYIWLRTDRKWDSFVDNVLT